MADLPQTHSFWRFPRVRLESAAPSVLRFPGGQRISANLQVVSVSGGLLNLAHAIVQGTEAKLMFVTDAGPVLGGIEMLQPVNNTDQPFRFVSLGADDQRRLGNMIWQRTNNDSSETAWMDKLRAASAEQNKPRRWRVKIAGAVGLFMIGLVAAAYLLNYDLFR